MNLFYSALEAQRKDNKEPGTVPENLAWITVNIEVADERYASGMSCLQSWLHTNPSTHDLTKYLPVFADFFTYVY